MRSDEHALSIESAGDEHEQSQQQQKQQQQQQQEQQQHHKTELERLCRWLEDDLQGRLQAISSERRVVSSLKMECDELHTRLNWAVSAVESNESGTLARATRAALDR
jgi:Na+/phosphate symporter